MATTEKNFNEVFMLTYRSFVIPIDFFYLLMDRFDIPPLNIKSKEEFQEFKINKLMPVR
jgi:hypothetical protein